MTIHRRGLKVCSSLSELPSVEQTGALTCCTQESVDRRKKNSMNMSHSIYVSSIVGDSRQASGAYLASEKLRITSSLPIEQCGALVNNKLAWFVQQSIQGSRVVKAYKRVDTRARCSLSIICYNI